MIKISALNGRGIDGLVETIRDRELRGGEMMELEIPHAQSRLLARLHEVAEIHGQRTTDNGQRISAWVPQSSIHEFENFSATDLLKRVKVS